MTDYTKSTNFTSKDSLSTGNPLKIIKGAEFDTEFNAIATAIATKTDNAAANITGGTITGITDLAIADGGTGASTASGARTNLGLVIGTNVQAWDADLDTWATKTAPAGTVVGTTDTQTLTNKTINGGALQTSTAIASTSGTSIDFTSIPSWVKRITVMFNGVSTNGTSLTQIQIGAGSIQTSGYTGTYSQAQSAANNLVNLSAGFVFDAAASASAVRNGFVILSLLESATGIWSASGQSGRSDSALFTTVAGVKSLSGTLDRVRITTVNGTDTFDAGSINILYE